MTLTRTFLALALATLAGTAGAVPATPEGGARLLALFQTYLGSQPGVVKVVPAGDLYRLSIDAAPFSAMIPAGAGSVTVSPIQMELVDQGDGTWLVTQDQRFELAMTIPGALLVSLAVDRVSGTGVFDESLASFVSSSADYTGIAFQETVTEPGGPTMDVAYSVDAAHAEAMASAGTAGGVDGQVTATMSGISESIRIPASPDQPMAMDLTITARTASSQIDYTGAVTLGLYDLIAFAVSHASPEAITADQAALKPLLRAALPLIEELSATSRVEDVTMLTPVGTIGFASAEVSVGMRGIVADGHIGEAIAVHGLTLPDGLVPAWAVPLVPKDVALDFDVAGYDLASPAAMLIEALNLAAPEPIPPGMENELLAALLPDGVVEVAIRGGRVTNDLYDVTATGSMTAGPVAMPQGQALITATGLDAALAVLRTAPPDLAEVALGLGAAKGMAKVQADGTLTWRISLTPDGSVLVNGVDPSTVFGQN